MQADDFMSIKLFSAQVICHWLELFDRRGVSEGNPELLNDPFHESDFSVSVVLSILITLGEAQRPMLT